MLGTWSIPPVTGDVPGAAAGFAFTKVSPHQVIRCGGPDWAIRMLDLSTMVSDEISDTTYDSIIYIVSI